MTSLNETPDCDRLLECREFFAAGFFRETECPTVVRMAQAVACHLGHMELPPWQGTRLYPGENEAGKQSSNLYSGHSAVCFQYAIPMWWDRRKLEQKIEEASGQRKQALAALQGALQEYPYFSKLGGFIHASVNFRRILSEGLNSYAARIQARQADAGKAGQSDKLVFYDAVQITLDGIRKFHTRVLGMLGAVSGATPQEERRRTALLEALRRVPFEPARTFHEAMVAENLIFHLDGCDGLGRFDQDLYPYYKASVEVGSITRLEALSLIEELWTNMERNVGWNVAIGGTAPDGTQGANELTLLCLEAAHNLGPGCIMLDWYATWGKDVGALPDGRKAGKPIADSAGPYQGRDRSGPTAMLSSVAKIPHHLAPGTLVLNARFSKELFRDPRSLQDLCDLVRTYFKMGGMQIQINVVDQETLMRAMEDPEAYADLIVRVAGYSAYWQSLNETVRRTILERAEHALAG